MSERAHAAQQALVDAFGLRRGQHLVSLVGGGGKTSLMFALGRALAAAGRRTMLTTTTRIATYERDLAPVVYHHPLAPGRPLPHETLSLLVETEGAGKAHGVPRGVPGQLLARPQVDVVLVEADGAQRRPVKAPAAHEPVVPPETTLLVIIAGMDALNRPVAVAHRPERVRRLIGGDQLTPAALAHLLTHEAGGLKGKPAGARAIIFLNKAETPALRAAAEEIARIALGRPAIERVVVGALHSARPVWAIHEAP